MDLSLTLTMIWWLTALLYWVVCVVGILAGESDCPAHDVQELKQCLLPVHQLLKRSDLPAYESCRTIKTFIRCVKKKSPVCDGFIRRTKVLLIALAHRRKYCTLEELTTTTTPAPTTTSPPTVRDLFGKCAHKFRGSGHRTLKQACRYAYKFLKCGDSTLWSYGFSVDTFQLHAELLRNRAVFWQRCTRRALYRGGVGRQHCPYDVTTQIFSCLNVTYWQQVAEGDVKTFCRVANHILPCLSTLANGCHHVTMLQNMVDFLWNTFHLMSDECSVEESAYSYLDYDYGSVPDRLPEEPPSMRPASGYQNKHRPQEAKPTLPPNQKPLKPKEPPQAKPALPPYKKPVKPKEPTPAKSTLPPNQKPFKPKEPPQAKPTLPPYKKPVNPKEPPQAKPTLLPYKKPVKPKEPPQAKPTLPPYKKPLKPKEPPQAKPTMPPYKKPVKPKEPQDVVDPSSLPLNPKEPVAKGSKPFIPKHDQEDKANMTEPKEVSTVKPAKSKVFQAKEKVQKDYDDVKNSSKSNANSLKTTPDQKIASNQKSSVHEAILDKGRKGDIGESPDPKMDRLSSNRVTVQPSEREQTSLYHQSKGKHVPTILPSKPEQNSIPYLSKGKPYPTRVSQSIKSNKTKYLGRKGGKQKARGRPRTNGTKEQLMRSAAREREMLSSSAAGKRTAHPPSHYAAHSKPSTPTTSPSHDPPRGVPDPVKFLPQQSANKRRGSLQFSQKTTMPPSQNNKTERLADKEISQGSVNSLSGEPRDGLNGAGRPEEFDSAKPSQIPINLPEKQPAPESGSPPHVSPALSGQKQNHRAAENASAEVHSEYSDQNDRNSKNNSQDAVVSHKSRHGGIHKNHTMSNFHKVDVKYDGDSEKIKSRVIEKEKPLKVNRPTAASRPVSTEKIAEKNISGVASLQAPVTVPTISTVPPIQVSSENQSINVSRRGPPVKENATTTTPKKDVSLTSPVPPSEKHAGSEALSMSKSSKRLDPAENPQNMPDGKVTRGVQSGELTTVNPKAVLNAKEENSTTADNDDDVGLSNKTDIDYNKQAAALEPGHQNRSLGRKDMSPSNSSAENDGFAKDEDGKPNVLDFERKHNNNNDNISDSNRPTAQDSHRPTAVSNDTVSEASRKEQSLPLPAKSDNDTEAKMDGEQNLMNATTSTQHTPLVVTDRPPEKRGHGENQGPPKISPSVQVVDDDGKDSPKQPQAQWVPWGNNCSHPWEGHSWCTSIMLRARLGSPQNECRSLQHYIICLNALLEACPGFAPFETISGTVEYVTSVFEVKCPEYRVDRLQRSEAPPP